MFQPLIINGKIVCYMDGGNLMISVHAALEAMGWPHDERHTKEMLSLIQGALKQGYPELPVQLADVCPRCGGHKREPRDVRIACGKCFGRGMVPRLE